MKFAMLYSKTLGRYIGKLSSYGTETKAPRVYMSTGMAKSSYKRIENKDAYGEVVVHEFDSPDHVEHIIK